MRVLLNITLVAALAVTAGCGASGSGPKDRDQRIADREAAREAVLQRRASRINRSGRQEDDLDNPNRTTIWDAFKRQETETSVQVNRYIWTAALDVLDFLPVQSVDPFTGIILTGYGTPPGGNRAYRATVHVKDPALDARALNVALQTRDGRAVSAATARAVEDAILSRARQLRIADKRL